MLVSVIIPCYNAEFTILECVESVLNQNYKNIEVICIDNNSSDNTWDKLLEIKKKYTHIIIDTELKQGASAARNKGLQIAKGNWIQFLDADDLLLKPKVEHQINLIKNATKPIAFVAGNCYYTKTKEILGKPYYTFSNKVWENLISGNIGCTCSNLFNVEILRLVNGWNENQKSSQEVELMFRVLKVNNDVIYDKEALTITISRPGSITNSNIKENAIRFLELRQQIYAYFKTMAIESDELKNILFSKLYYTIMTIARYDLKLANYYFRLYFSQFRFLSIQVLPFYKKVFYSIFGFNITEIIITKIKK